MKKIDLEEIRDALNNIKKIADLQSYNISSKINQEIIKISPKILDELERKDISKIEIDCPAIKILYEKDFHKALVDNMEDLLNLKLIELVQDGYKIIDYNICNLLNDKCYAYIKYTS